MRGAYPKGTIGDKSDLLKGSLNRRESVRGIESGIQTGRRNRELYSIMPHGAISHAVECRELMGLCE